MILQALIAYADQKQLGDPDFEAVGVRWLLSLSPTGNLVGDPTPLADDPAAKRPGPKKMLRPFTSPNELTQGTKSHFLCDTLERTLLFLDPKAEGKAEARQVQQGYYRHLLNEAALHARDESQALHAVEIFLSNEEAIQHVHAKLLEGKAKPSDNVIFSVGGRNLIESESLRTFWRERRRSIDLENPRKPRICIASGQFVKTLDTTEKIKGLPGGLAVGSSLISFDKDSFCSYGLEQAQNAALSANSELKIRAALNLLIEEARRQGAVFHETIHLQWTREPSLINLPHLLINPDPQTLGGLFKSIHSRPRPASVDTNAYYALSLSTNGARVVVRNWIESTVTEVERNLADWFTDLAMVNHDGIETKRDFKLAALLYAMVREDLAELPSQIPSFLLNAALLGRNAPLPHAVLAAALRRLQRDLDNRINLPRFALIKACLLRSKTLSSNTPSAKAAVTESLNPQCSDSAYRCGRLFAAIDRLQYIALGGVNAGILDRYYATASVKPSFLMGQLLHNAKFYLARIHPHTASKMRKDIQEIASEMQQYPASLDLEAQGRFALGYYHQKADYHRRKL